MKPVRSEFDAYSSDGYSAGMEDTFKRLIGESSQIFLEHKAAWLFRHLEADRLRGGQCRLLDFGCGTGAFLVALQTLGFDGPMEGCDVSEGMIAQSRAMAFPLRPPTFHHIHPGPLDFPAESFDLVTVVCVYHHIEPEQRQAVTKELARVLKPGGEIYFFEHNPWNPATQMIVRRCTIDQNAKLLTPRDLAPLLREAGFSEPKSEYILFFPLRWRAWWSLEQAFAWLPLGGQYVTWARKPARP